MMDPPSFGFYADPTVHRAVSAIIRRHSTNPADIRDVALEEVDFDGVGRLLDLGCGFGYMVEALAARAGPGTEIVGMDAHAGNRDAVIRAAESRGCRGRFIGRMLHSQLDFAAATFDGITASYSLYFFPGIIPEAARVMKPDGFFVALTHSRLQFHGLLEALGISPESTVLHSLVGGFSAENGGKRLERYFDQVTSRFHHNDLVFFSDEMEDYLALLRFKLPFLLPAHPVEPCVPDDLLAGARRLIEERGRIVVEKDDAVFLCRNPRTR